MNGREFIRNTSLAASAMMLGSMRQAVSNVKLHAVPNKKVTQKPTIGCLLFPRKPSTKLWCIGQDSNLQPSDPKSEALSN